MNYLLTMILALTILFPVSVLGGETPTPFTLFYSSDMHGETEPCG